VFAAGATVAGARKCLLRTKKPRTAPVPEPEKAPLAEVKIDGIELDEAKPEPAKEDEVVEVAAEETAETEKLIEDDAKPEESKE